MLAQPLRARSQMCRARNAGPADGSGQVTALNLSGELPPAFSRHE